MRGVVLKKGQNSDTISNFLSPKEVVLCLENVKKARDVLGLRPLNIPFPFAIFFCHRFQHFAEKQISPPFKIEKTNVGCLGSIKLS